MTTEERIEKLERELAKTKRGGRRLLALLGAGLVGLGLAWGLTKTTATVQPEGAAAVPKTIRANAFVLEDPKGNVCARLDVLADSAGLVLLDEKQKPRVSLRVGEGGPALSLNDEKGNPRAGLTVANDGPILLLYDDKANVRAALGVQEHGGAINLWNEHGTLFWGSPK